MIAVNDLLRRPAGKPIRSQAGRSPHSSLHIHLRLPRGPTRSGRTGWTSRAGGRVQIFFVISQIYQIGTENESGRNQEKGAREPA